MIKYFRRSNVQMLSISIIIPLYKGSKYIDYWVEKVIQNYELLKNKHDCKVELIFVNDYPVEKVPGICSDKEGIKIVVLNLPSNRGIHGARVAGIQIATGEFVLMVDQDDKIENNYLLSQISKLGEADAILCNGYKDRVLADVKLKIYSSVEELCSACMLNTFIKNGCQIVSPGQVLLKKNSIPKIWLECILHVSGADDLLLWLLMLGDGKNFAVNEEGLYTHVRHWNNTSGQSAQMSNSEQEVVKILEEKCALPQKQIRKLQKRYNEGNNLKFYEIFLQYDRWMYLQLRGVTISNYLKKKGFNNVTVYGLGYLGARLYDELKRGDINLIAGIDRNVIENTECVAPMVTMDSIQTDELIQKSDVIIVTVIDGYEKIKENIDTEYEITVLSFGDILNEMIEEVALKEIRQ